MKIIDINGKQRTVKNNIKVITDTRKNVVGQVCHENVNGELVTTKEMSEVEVNEKFVEVTIIGRNREWVEWYPLEKFEGLNSDIIL